MIAIKGHFDGEKVILPPEARLVPPGDVIVVFHNGAPDTEGRDWMKLQEEPLRKVWDNDDDAVYDSL